MLWLRRAFAGAATAWTVALMVAPLVAARPQPSIVGYGFALVMYAAGSLICHQRPERSFYVLGVQLPVCARCIGIYAGAALTVIASVPGVRTLCQGVGSSLVARDFSPAPRAILLIAALPTAATLLFEWTTGHAPGNWTRAVSGAPLGAAVAWIVSGPEISPGQVRPE